MVARVAHLVIGAVVAVPVVSAVPVASAPAPPAREVELKLVAQRDKSFNLSFPVAPSTFIVSGSLLDQADGSKVGSGKSVCMFTDIRPLALPPEASADCRSVYSLADGEIHLSSSRVYQLDLNGIHYKETRLAVVGGTDEYRTARGDATASFQNSAAGRVRYAIDIRLSMD